MVPYIMETQGLQHFYEVFNDFVLVFKGLIFGKDFPWMSHQMSKLLGRRGTLEQMENYNVIRIFGSKVNPSFLPCHISDTMFLAQIARKYSYWLHFFHENRKKQFMTLPWKVEGFILRNLNKIDEFEGHFHSLNLKYVEKLKGFNPNGIFVKHLLVVGFNNYFINIILNEDKDNASGSPSHETSDMETILITNGLYKKKQEIMGEKSAQSQTTTPKTIESQRITLMAYPCKKFTHSYSSGGGDKNPPYGKIEIYHKIPTIKK
jgi:hypothetical protein